MNKFLEACEAEGNLGLKVPARNYQFLVGLFHARVMKQARIATTTRLWNITHERGVSVAN
jgi:hypothetical protein